MSFLTKKISRDRLDRLIRNYATDEQVLEIGAYGHPDYRKYFPNCTGVDIRPGPGVDRVASVYELPFEDSSFSVVLCLSVLEHLTEPAKGIQEIRRVLKPGGQAVISVPFIFPIHEAPDDYWRFTKYGLKHLFRDGWSIETLQAESGINDSFAILLQRLGYQSHMRFNKLSKGFIFFLARIIESMPTMATKVFGDIKKKTEEPDAFASAFFLVVKKI